MSHSPSRKEVCGLLDNMAGDGLCPRTGKQCGAPNCQDADLCAEGAHDRIVEIVDGLAIEKSAMRDLLERARAYLPARGPEPPCTCRGGYEVGAHGYCERHDTGWDEPTLLEEIENLLKPPTDEPG